MSKGTKKRQEKLLTALKRINVLVRGPSVLQSSRWATLSRARRGLALLLILAAGWTARAETFSFDLQYFPEVENLSTYDLCVLDPAARVDLTRAHQAGNQVLAYISVGEIGSDAWYREEALETATIKGTNPNWGSSIVDVSDPAWADYVINRLAWIAVEKGYDGFFLDTVDVMSELAQQEPGRTAAFYDGMVAIIRGLKAAYPSRRIIINRGFEIYARVKDAIDGFLVESLFLTFGDWYESQDAGSTAWLNQHLQPVKQGGTPIYVLDYCDPSASELAWETAEKIRALGYNALVMARLDGNVLATLSAGEVRPSPTGRPVILNNPLSATVPAGRSVIFRVEAHGPDLAYQWRWKGANIKGANAPTLALTGVKTTWSGPYSVVVSNPSGMATSAQAVLNVTRKKTRR